MLLCSRLHQFSKLFLFSPSSGLYSCPLAMTDGAARLIEVSRNYTQIHIILNTYICTHVHIHIHVLIKSLVLLLSIDHFSVAIYVHEYNRIILTTTLYTGMCNCVLFIAIGNEVKRYNGCYL